MRPAQSPVSGRRLQSRNDRPRGHTNKQSWSNATRLPERAEIEHHPNVANPGDLRIASDAPWVMDDRFDTVTEPGLNVMRNRHAHTLVWGLGACHYRTSQTDTPRGPFLVIDNIALVLCDLFRSTDSPVDPGATRAPGVSSTVSQSLDHLCRRYRPSRGWTGIP